MIRAFFISAALLAVIAPATAQVVVSDFKPQVASLGTYMAQGNTSSASSTMSTLNGLMNTQMTWLQSRINTNQATSTSDSLAVIAASNSKDNTKITSARSALAAVQTTLATEKSKLATEKSMYNALQALTTNMSKVTTAQQTQIIADLNTFLQTLGVR